MCSFPACFQVKQMPALICLPLCAHGREDKRKTNLSNKGLTSADRSNKATLLLTVPSSIQVVCKRFTPAHIEIAIRRQTSSTFPQSWPNLPHMVHEHKALFQHIYYTQDQHCRLWHGFWLRGVQP